MIQAPVSPAIEIRHCATLAEFEDCLRLEHAVWGDGEDIAVPVPIFAVAHHTGGQVLGAFDGPKMAGFTLALHGTRDNKTFLHSHMTAVLPEYRDRGIGRRLKLFQREDALARGIDLVEWTFDPLELKNAHFNLNRLGAVARRYVPNIYGITNSPLHAGLPTDRLVAEWWLASPRVKAILENRPLAAKGPSERFPLPANMAEIKQDDPDAAIRIQTGIRGQFLRAFANGQLATSIEARVARVDYILEPAGQIAGLELPEFHKD
ncbi:MAG: GNAT family N-acetyltransferase [Candidatus Acidiferrales bacterium]|jgi:predicted GNAT superfamily acetyltransferase